MNDVPENELLSAYLDGELTTEEEAEVQRLLATSPTARQLLGQLRALSSTLQNMPQQTLGEDISKQVLRRAEREILAQADPSASPGQLPTPAAPLPRPIFRRLFNRRALIGASLALAVAMVIILTDPGGWIRSGDTEVARTESADEDDREPPSIGPVRDARKEPDVPAPAAESNRGSAAHGEVANHAAPDEPVAATAAGGVAPKSRPEAPSTLLESANGASRDTGLHARGEQPAARPTPQAPKAVDAAAAQDTTQINKAASALGGVAADEGGTGGLIGKDGLGRGRAGDPNEQAPGARFFTNRSSQLDGRTQLAFRVDEAAVVCCDVSHEAVREQTFRELLVHHKITLQESRSAPPIVGFTGPAGKKAADRASQEYKAGELSGRFAERLPKKDQPKTEAWLKAVLISATSAQVEAILADLRTRRAAFPRLFVKPAEGVEAQRGWDRYSRDVSPEDRDRRLMLIKQLPALQADTTSAADYAAQPPAGAQAGQAVERPDESAADSSELPEQTEESAHQGDQQESERLELQPRRYGVWFVLRMVGPGLSNPPAAAAARVRAATEASAEVQAADPPVAPVPPVETPGDK